MINKKIILMLLCVNLICAQNMKVLVISIAGFPPCQGAAVLNHITGLIDLNCFVKIFAKRMASSMNPNKDIVDYKLMDKLIIKDIPKDIEQYDVILVETGFRAKELLKYKSNRTKLIVCFRGRDVGYALTKDPHYYDELFAKGDLFLPVCESFKNELIQHGCPKEKIKVLHSAIDCNVFDYKKRDIKKNDHVKIVSVCRLIPKKGLEYAIHAVAELVKQGFNIEYTIVGEGLLHESLDALINRLDMQNCINLVGRKSITEVATYLHANHIFLLPSITADDGDEEGIPNAAKEAMACGLPVILTDHSGNGELVEHGISGLLVEQKSVAALENALRYLIENKQLWNKFGKAGRKKVEKDFEKSTLSKKLYDLLKQVIDDAI